MELNEAMRVATDLTRQGRLVEATAAIQAVLGGVMSTPWSMPQTADATRPPSAPIRTLLPDGSVVDEEPRVRPGDDTRDRARFVDGSFTNDGLTRRYKLFVPRRATTRPALVVMLHGCTQDPDDFARGTRANERAEVDGTLVLYPAQPHDANPSGCWNWFRPQDQSRGHGEAALIAEMTRDIMRNHDIDPRKVFVAGLSAGGAMAAILAHEYPDLYAAACVHSGLPAGAARSLPEALQAMRAGSPAGAKPSGRAVPTIVFHGDQDRTVHPSNADAVVVAVLRGAHVSILDVPQRRETRDARGRRVVRATYFDAQGNALVEQWTLHGAGHAWAGGSPDGSHTDRSGIDATAEMMRFFGEHARPAPSEGARPPGS